MPVMILLSALCTYPPPPNGNRCMLKVLLTPSQSADVYTTVDGTGKNNDLKATAKFK